MKRKTWHLNGPLTFFRPKLTVFRGACSAFAVSLRNVVVDTLATRDQIMAGLTKGDDAVLSQPQPVFLKLEQDAAR